MSDLYDAQKDLLKWIDQFSSPFRSYAAIKQACTDLAEQRSLGIDKHPHRKLFIPLLYTGVVEMSQPSRFTSSPCIRINANDSERYLIINPRNLPLDGATPYPGVHIYSAENAANSEITKEYTFYCESILRNFPTIEAVVLSFQTSLIDPAALTYYSRSLANKCVGYIEENPINKYFAWHEKAIYKDIPPFTQNPDALNLTWCFERIINKKENGVYKQGILRFPVFGMPILIYRVMFVESLLNGGMPAMEGEDYVFPNIGRNVVKELNRIYSNSIKSV